MLGSWHYHYHKGSCLPKCECSVHCLFVGNDVNAKDDNDHTCVHAAAICNEELQW